MSKKEINIGGTVPPAEEQNSQEQPVSTQASAAPNIAPNQLLADYIQGKAALDILREKSPISAAIVDVLTVLEEKGMNAAWEEMDETLKDHLKNVFLFGSRYTKSYIIFPYMVVFRIPSTRESALGNYYRNMMFATVQNPDEYVKENLYLTAIYIDSVRPHPKVDELLKNLPPEQSEALSELIASIPMPSENRDEYNEALIRFLGELPTSHYNALTDKLAEFWNIIELARLFEAKLIDFFLRTEATS